MGQLPASAACRGDAKAVAFIEPEVLQTPSRTHDGATVRGIGNGTIIDALNANLTEGWNAGNRSLNMRGQTVEVLLEQLIFRLRIGSVDIANRRADLVGAKQKATGLLAHVPRAVALTQNAHFRQASGLARLNGGMGLGDDILVLYGNDRHIKANHRARAAGKVAGRGNDVLAGDVALIGLDQPFAIGLLNNAGHGGLTIDGRATVTRAACEGLGQVGGLDIAVIRMLDRAQQVVGLAQGPDFLDLVRGQELDVNTDGLGHTRIIFVLVHPVLGPGQTDVADIAKADLQIGLGLKGGIEAHRIFVHLANRVAQIEQGQQARRVPGRAGGQLLAFDQNHIAPAQLGQMVKGADTDDSAANDDRTRVSFHEKILLEDMCAAKSRAAFDLRGLGETAKRIDAPPRWNKYDFGKMAVWPSLGGIG